MAHIKRPWVDFARSVDKQLKNPNHRQALEPCMGEWIRTVREAIGLTATAMGRRVGITQPSLTALEKSEAAGTISIEKLRTLADALGCDFVYGFIPREPFENTAGRYELDQEDARKLHRRVPRVR